MRMLSRTKELCYLTSFVIRLFEDAEKVRVKIVVFSETPLSICFEGGLVDQLVKVVACETFFFLPGVVFILLGI